jgi:NAD(P)-dependent dehydrogenase (short-subunit alcohol dehydrogenase family)
MEVVTRVAVLELGASGVRVNAVAPSFVPTQRVAYFAADPAFLAERSAAVSLGRLAETTDRHCERSRLVGIRRRVVRQRAGHHG